MKNKLYIPIIILTILGITQAFYLSYEAYNFWFTTSKMGLLGGSFCDLSDTFSCSSFLANPRALIFGIPFPMIAAVVYPLLFLLAIIGFFRKSPTTAKIITILAIGGFCFNGYVISQEIIVGVFCPLCALCTVYIFLIAILGGLIWKSAPKK